MRRLVARLICAVLVAGPVSAQAQVTFRDTLAYTTASVRLREKPERACFGRAAQGRGRSSIHVLSGVVQRRCFAAPGILTRRVSYRPSAASSDVTGARLHQFPGGTGPIAHAYCGWQAPRGGHSPLSGWDVQLQPHAAGDVLASWGRGGVVEGVGRGVS